MTALDVQQFLANPCDALSGPFATMMLRLWISRLVALGILKWGTATWIPQVVEHYRTTYFLSEFPRPLRRGFLSHWSWMLLQATVVYFIGYGHVPEILPFLAVLVLALQGVVVADLRFQVIPDRFQLAGAFGAAGFAVLAWLPPETAPTTLRLATLPLEPLLYQAAAGTGVAAGLWLAGWLYSRIRHREAMGLGDIKLIGWLGLAFGTATLNVLFYSLIAAAVLIFPLWLIRRRRFEQTFAFGPFIVLGCAVHAVVLAGAQAQELLRGLGL